MIIVIRKHLKTKLLRNIFYMIMGIFMLFFILPDLSQRITPTENWAIKVNDKKIDYVNFARLISKYELNIATVREQYGSYADVFLRMLGLTGNLKQVAVRELIQKELLHDVARQVPIYISDAYIEHALNNVQIAQRSGLTELLPLGFFGQYGLEYRALCAYLAQQHMNMSQFESLVEEALAEHIALQLAFIGAYVPSFMIDKQIRHELAAKNYTIIRLSSEDIRKELCSKGTSQEELETFFETENKKSKRYVIPEMRAATVWKFTPEEYGTSVSEDQLKEYYEKYRTTKYIEEPVKIQVRRILLAFSDSDKDAIAQRAQQLHDELLNDPTTFEIKARQYSDDKSSASKGGMLPLFAKGERNASFERKAFLLHNDNDISDVFESDEGYEIIQRVQKQAAKSKPFSDVKHEIYNSLLKQNFIKQFEKDMKHKLVQKKLDEEFLQTFVQEKNGSMHQISLAPKDDSKRMQLLFKLKKEEASAYTEDGVGYVILLTEKKAAYIPELSAIQTTVHNDFIDHLTQKRLLQVTNQAFKAIGHEQPKNIAQKYNGYIEETGFIHQGDEQANQLQAKGVPVTKMFQIAHKGAASSCVQKDGYVFYLSDLTEVPEEEFNQKKKEKASGIYNEAGSLFAQGFVASLARNAKIEINELLSTQIEKQAL